MLEAERLVASQLFMIHNTIMYMSLLALVQFLYHVYTDVITRQLQLITVVLFVRRVYISNNVTIFSDDENDLIRLSNNEELREAKTYLTNGLLKVFVKGLY